VNTVSDQDRFTHELGGWVLRGVLCAGVSIGWAVVADFSSSEEIAVLAGGVLAWWRFGPGLLLKLKLSPPRFAR
jgi:hypothetical protein